MKEKKTYEPRSAVLFARVRASNYEWLRDHCLAKGMPIAIFIDQRIAELREAEDESAA